MALSVLTQIKSYKQCCSGLNDGYQLNTVEQLGVNAGDIVIIFLIGGLSSG